MRISKRIALTLALVTSALSVFAQPTLKKLLTAEEWKAAGLDRLTPAEIAVIESALHRQPQPVAPVPPPAAVVPTAPQPSSPSPAIIASPTPQQVSTPTATTRATPTAAAAAPALSPESIPESSRGWLSRFGLPDFKDTDWRKLPPLQAKVVSWESANRFILDNGQAWEGTDLIPDELVGRPIEIHARPNNRFTLILDGKNTKVRVVRVR